MTFKTVGVVAFQNVLPIFLRQWNLIAQHIEDCFQLFKLLRLIKNPFLILLELSRIAEFFHNPIDLSMASTLDVSTGPLSFPALASFMAAMVSSLGS